MGATAEAARERREAAEALRDTCVAASAGHPQRYGIGPGLHGLYRPQRHLPDDMWRLLGRIDQEGER